MMKVTYSPPPGEDRSVVYFDVEFFAGRAEDIDPFEYPLLARKVKGNALFVVSESAEADGEDAEAPRRRGRPPKVKADGEDPE